MPFYFVALNLSNPRRIKWWNQSIINIKHFAFNQLPIYPTWDLASFSIRLLRRPVRGSCLCSSSQSDICWLFGPFSCVFCHLCLQSELLIKISYGIPYFCCLVKFIILIQTINYHFQNERLLTRPFYNINFILLQSISKICISNNINIIEFLYNILYWILFPWMLCM